MALIVQHVGYARIVRRCRSELLYVYQGVIIMAVNPDECQCSLLDVQM
jgi:hypothetical protein